jgi:acyl transferase domain-containing protein
VQSFGFGGMNAHMVLDDAENFLLAHSLQGNSRQSPSSDAELSSKQHQNYPPQLIVLSAPNRAAVKRQLRSYESHFQQMGIAHDLLDLAYTLCERRSIFSWKVCALIKNTEELKAISSVANTPVLSLRDQQLILVFTGQGAQWQEMGHDLMLYPAFRDTIISLQTYLVEFGCEWSLLGKPFSVYEGLDC